jgi:hypothetical protein
MCGTGWGRGRGAHLLIQLFHLFLCLFFLLVFPILLLGSRGGLVIVGRQTFLERCKRTGEKQARAQLADGKYASKKADRSTTRSCYKNQGISTQLLWSRAGGEADAVALGGVWDFCAVKPLGTEDQLIEIKANLLSTKSVLSLCHIFQYSQSPLDAHRLDLAYRRAAIASDCISVVTLFGINNYLGIIKVVLRLAVPTLDISKQTRLGPVINGHLRTNKPTY